MLISKDYNTSILFFGGTFDPPHRAHIELPRHVADAIECDQIVYIPTAANPLKHHQPTDGSHRVAMLELALSECDTCSVSTVELERPGPSFTVDTLGMLRKRYDPKIGFRFLMGADGALSFHRWKMPERILELATPAVMLRPPHDRDAFGQALAEMYSASEVESWLSWTMDVPLIDVSSSAIRLLISTEQDPGSDISEAVHKYIVEHGLYR